MLKKGFFIRAFQVLTGIFFVAMMTCVCVDLIAGDCQPPVLGITFFQWLWTAIGFLALFYGSLIAAIKLSGENSRTSPQEESS